MAKKIDLINKDNNSFKTRNKRSKSKMTVKKKAGSKKNITTAPKKRGRKPRKIIEDGDNLDDHLNNQNTKKTQRKSKTPATRRGRNANPTVILHFPASKLDKLKDKAQELNIQENTSLESENSIKISDNIFENDIPDDIMCSKCTKNEKTIDFLKKRIKKLEKHARPVKPVVMHKVKLNLASYNTNKKIVNKKKIQKYCLWEGHPFDNDPCYLPESYHDNTYYVTGCFCSFNCALAYNLYFIRDSKISHRKSLVYKMYRELHGFKSDDFVELKEAGPREMIDSYGGTISIDDYRKNFKFFNKEYILFLPPIKPINPLVEEKNTDADSDLSENKYSLKRSKPRKRKSSIISSMKMKIKE